MSNNNVNSNTVVGISPIFKLLIGENCLEICYYIWEFITFKDVLNLKLVNKKSFANIDVLFYEKALKRDLYFVINKYDSVNDINITYINLQNFDDYLLPEKYLQPLLNYVNAPNINNRSTEFVNFVKFESMRKLFNILKHEEIDHTKKSVSLDLFYDNPLLLELIEINGYVFYRRFNTAYKILRMDSNLNAMVDSIKVNLFSDDSPSSVLINYSDKLQIIISAKAVYIHDDYDAHYKLFCAGELNYLEFRPPGFLLGFDRIDKEKKFQLVKRYISYKLKEIPKVCINILVETLFFIIDDYYDCIGNQQYEKEMNITTDLINFYFPYSPETQVFELACLIYHYIDHARFNKNDDFIFRIFNEKIRQIQYVPANLIDQITFNILKYYNYLLKYENPLFEDLFNHKLFDL